MEEGVGGLHSEEKEGKLRSRMCAGERWLIEKPKWGSVVFCFQE